MTLHLTISIQDADGRPLLSKAVKLTAKQCEDTLEWVASDRDGRFIGYGRRPECAAIDWLDNVSWAGGLDRDGL